MRGTPTNLAGSPGLGHAKRELARRRPFARSGFGHCAGGELGTGLDDHAHDIADEPVVGHDAAVTSADLVFPERLSAILKRRATSSVRYTPILSVMAGAAAAANRGLIPRHFQQGMPGHAGFFLAICKLGKAGIIGKPREVPIASFVLDPRR
jgi:hypothetical protein